APHDSVDYRTSWEYWAAIHGYLGPDSMNGTVEQNKQARIDRIKAHQNDPNAPDVQVAQVVSNYFAGMNDLSVPDEEARKIWNPCEHSTPIHTTRYFLAWHRMFLYFFERVLREASGDPNFALPYWDYTNDKIDAAFPAKSPWRIPETFALRMINPENLVAC